MTKRKELECCIAALRTIINNAQKEIVDIRKETLLLSDEVQQFTEEIESHPRQKYERKDNWLDGKLIGRIHWKEGIKDEDTGEIITINRNQIVRVDGDWECSFQVPLDNQYETLNTVKYEIYNR